MTHEREAAPETQVFSPSKVIIASSYGFCGGVIPAIGLVEDLLRSGRQVLTDNDIVHNKPLMADLTERGFQNIGQSWRSEQFDPAAKTFVVSAHGTSDETLKRLKDKGFDVWNATCRLVERVHGLIKKAEIEGYYIVYRGVRKHPETEGSLGAVANHANISLIESPEDVYNLVIPADKKVIMFSQTTLMPKDVEDCEKAMFDRYGNRLTLPSRRDICPATINRQEAVENLSSVADIIIVIGSKTSHNSQELVRVAGLNGVEAHLIDAPPDINPSWFTNMRTIGLTAGASVLDRFIDPVLEWFRRQNPNIVFEHSANSDKRDKPFKLLPETQARWDALKLDTIYA